jgi:hypothetical protein
VSCEAEFTASVEAKVAPLAIAIFLRYSSDPVITALSQAGRLAEQAVQTLLDPTLKLKFVLKKCQHILHIMISFI